LVARLSDHSLQAIATRFQMENRLYLAFMGEVPVAYGWMATQQGSISALQLSFAIPSRNSYLYNFQTFPEGVVVASILICSRPSFTRNGLFSAFGLDICPTMKHRVVVSGKQAFIW
jgi:hypothetical protein